MVNCVIQLSKGQFINQILGSDFWKKFKPPTNHSHHNHYRWLFRLCNCVHAWLFELCYAFTMECVDFSLDGPILNAWCYSFLLFNTHNDHLSSVGQGRSRLTGHFVKLDLGGTNLTPPRSSLTQTWYVFVKLDMDNLKLDLR